APRAPSVRRSSSARPKPRPERRPAPSPNLRPDRIAAAQSTEPMADIDQRLEELARQHDQVQAQLGDPAVTSDPDAIRRLGQELARLEPVVAAHRALLETRRELAGAREMRDAEADDELRAMAREEVDRLEAEEARQVDALKLLLLPR